MLADTGAPAARQRARDSCASLRCKTVPLTLLPLFSVDSRPLQDLVVAPGEFQVRVLSLETQEFYWNPASTAV